ncbi:putative esterase/lipase [Trichoplax sp. H2]|nr:putative esterase/lipase [Trichoplax sp. H2]|eukprot:RDD36801.1 putative esterase/lipase [Trichoplax sp. H2]
MTSTYFKYKNSELHYQICGQGPTLLFIQGLLWDKNLWRSQCQFLSKYYQCVVVELWEHGLSGHIPDHLCTLETLADDIWQLTRHLKLTKFAIIGFSVGGTIGVHLALTHPSSVMAIMLLNTPLSEEPAKGKQLYDDLMTNVQKMGKLSHETINGIVENCLSLKTKENHPLITQQIRKHLESIPTSNIKGIFTICRAVIDRKSILERIYNMDIPIQILVGQEENPLILKEIQKIQHKFKNGHVVVIPGSAHLSMIEQPDIVCKVLMKHLNKYLFETIFSDSD